MESNLSSTKPNFILGIFNYVEIAIIREQNKSYLHQFCTWHYRLMYTTAHHLYSLTLGPVRVQYGFSKYSITHCIGHAGS
jgi:hypothetical protein